MTMANEMRKKMLEKMLAECNAEEAEWAGPPTPKTFDLSTASIGDMARELVTLATMWGIRSRNVCKRCEPELLAEPKRQMQLILDRIDELCKTALD